MAFNTNPGKQSFTATSGQTVFDFNFKIYDETNLKVYLTPTGSDPNDADDILTYGTEYTVVIDGDDGGTVTLLTGATLNDTIVIARDLPQVRDTSYVTNGDLKAATLNIDQDYQTYLILDGYVALQNTVQLPQSAVGVDPVLPNVRSDSYLKWNSAGDGLENDETIPQAVIDSADNVLNANSWANEAEDVPVKVYTNGVPAARVPTVYSALHYRAKAEGFSDEAELEKWEAEAEALTALSYATEAEDTPVNVVTSDGDGTFTYTPQAGVFSSLHYATKAATFNPALYALLTGATFTGQVKGITPVSDEDLTRKDYVDDRKTEAINVGFGINQTWKNVKASRSAGVSYQNTSGKAIQVFVNGDGTTGAVLSALVDGITIGRSGTGSISNRSPLSFVVASGATYRVDLTAGSIEYWSELRS